MNDSGRPLVSAVAVVPCFNEARRLDPERFLPLTTAGVTVLFVDDGSTDRTPELIEAALTKHADLTSLSLPENRGKGESVRLGMLHAIDSGAAVVGFIDADLAAPPEELLRLFDRLLGSPNTRVVTGARVGLMGMNVERSMTRHYLSRVFATFAALMLREKIYDTQCGAKMFRVDDRLREALSTPFETRWIFDVELLNRLLSYSKEREHDSDPGIREVPLEEWHEVPESKMTIRSMTRASIDLLRLEVLQRWSGRHNLTVQPCPA